MMSSTPIPMLIAAIVILIISSGMPSAPITPKTAQSGIKFEMMAMAASLMLLKIMQNTINSAKTTKPKESTCETMRLWSKLL